MLRTVRIKFLVVIASCILTGAVVRAGELDLLYPDMFPFLSEDSNLPSLRYWILSGNSIGYSTLFANQGDGLFEIRRGDAISADRYELLQRVYVGSDFGANYVDIPIGSAPIPGTPGAPVPNDINAIWFEDFTHFSLRTAPVVDGVLTLGEEVAGVTKTSWRLSANQGPLPGFDSPPNYTSPDQRVQQRISAGWADLYGAGSRGQVMDITGVPVGPLYWLQQTVDPANRIHESDETNNVAQVLIDLRKPGEVVMYDGRFVQPGDAAPPTPGDLTADGVVDLDDWLAFKASSGASLDGLSERDLLALGDLNLDGRHSLSDARLFREYYDAANGTGAFASLTSSVPEPTSFLLIGVTLTAIGVTNRRQLGKAVAFAVALTAFSAISSGRVASARVLLFEEGFEGLALGPNLNESLSNPHAWTQTPPAGWSVDDSGVPTINLPSVGVKEWEGWSFADKVWWSNAAQNQGRSEFTLGQGTVAVADPDEWDDHGAPASGSPFRGYYNAWMQTPEIDLGSAAPGSAKLTFASSWRDECCDDGPQTNSQTAVVRASYDGGVTFGDALRWNSTLGSEFFKDDATNEQVLVNLDNPANAPSVILQFGLLNAGNDWWWAVDNIEVYAPTTLVIDNATGVGTLIGADGITGYEITSSSGSLDPDSWRSENLDARNFGSPTLATADYNNDGHVDAADYTIWRDGKATGGYSDWASQYGASVGLSQSWETVIAEDSLLYEFFLGGESTFESESIGKVYDQSGGVPDLRFTYALANGQEIQGGVVYVGALSVPEPSAMTLLLAPAVLSSVRRKPTR
ncbi:hypothetical protein K2D_28980 [Planctomycetes bacterium K2D]|nr:hypothetical protein K2D_28980 [Planctomycetes bacterium K2D]